MRRAAAEPVPGAVEHLVVARGGRAVGRQVLPARLALDDRPRDRPWPARPAGWPRRAPARPAAARARAGRAAARRWCCCSAARRAARAWASAARRDCSAAVIRASASRWLRTAAVCSRWRGSSAASMRSSWRASLRPRRTASTIMCRCAARGAGTRCARARRRSPWRRARPRRRRAGRPCSAGAASWPARARLSASRARRRTRRSRVTRSSRWVSARRACQRARSPCASARRADMTATARDVARSRRPSRAAAEASWRSRPFWRSMWLAQRPGVLGRARGASPPPAVGERRAGARRRSSPDGVSGACGGA